MNSDLIIKEQLESLMLSNWTNVLNKTLLLRRVLEDARDSDLKLVKNDVASTPKTKITITKFHLLSNGTFEIWVEFSVPKDNKMAVGTHVYALSLTGILTKLETCGVLFET